MAKKTNSILLNNFCMHIWITSLVFFKMISVVWLSPLHASSKFNADQPSYESYCFTCCGKCVVGHLMRLCLKTDVWQTNICVALIWPQALSGTKTNNEPARRMSDVRMEFLLIWNPCRIERRATLSIRWISFRKLGFAPRVPGFQINIKQVLDRSMEVKLSALLGRHTDQPTVSLPIINVNIKRF